MTMSPDLDGLGAPSGALVKDGSHCTGRLAEQPGGDPADRPLCNQKIADRGVVRQSSSGTAIDGRVQTLSKARDRFGRHCRRKQGGTVPREGEVGDLHRPHPGEIIFSGRTASSNSASVR